MSRIFLIICFVQLFGIVDSYAQTTFRGGECGVLKWNFIGSYREEGRSLRTQVFLRDSDSLIQLHPECNCDSSFTISPNSYLVASRTVLDIDNSYWNDSTKQRIFPRKEVFRDSIIIDTDDTSITYHFWLDKNEDWFKLPPKEDVALLFINAEFNYNKGFGFSPGLGIEFEGDLGNLSHALFGISINGEFNRHQGQWIYGGKLMGEIHLAELMGTYIPLGAKIGYWGLTDGENKSSKLTAEIGFSLLGSVYVMAGYNFNINHDSFTTLQGWRFSFGIRKLLFIERVRKDAKYNSNIENEIQQL